MSLLMLDAVYKRYGTEGSPAAVQALDGISLTVEAGESVAVTGPSGCGKSTFLNIAGALDRPTSGSVTLAGKDLDRLPEETLAEIRNREIGFVFQAHHLLPQCTVLENVLIPTLAFPGSREERRADIARAEALLRRVGLMERRDHRPCHLSGGEMQRTAVVRALINRPRLLLADEPTGSLDRAAANALADLLSELNRDDGLTLIVVTHSMELAKRMKRTYTLENGRLKQ